MPEANYLLSVSWGYIKVRDVYMLDLLSDLLLYDFSEWICLFLSFIVETKLDASSKEHKYAKYSTSPTRRPWNNASCCNCSGSVIHVGASVRRKAEYVWAVIWKQNSEKHTRSQDLGLKFWKSSGVSLSFSCLSLLYRPKKRQIFCFFRSTVLPVVEPFCIFMTQWGVFCFFSPGDVKLLKKKLYFGANVVLYNL